MSEARAGTDVRPLSPTRRVVARRMAESARTIPAVTLHRRARFDGLLALRARLDEPGGRRPATDALLARTVAVALSRHELLNGRWQEDSLAVRVYPHRDIAVAVDTPHGLTAVVLRDADQRDVAELTEDLGARVGRALEGRSRLDDLRDATFTISNLGPFGVEAFTPMITPGQAAILGIGAITDGPDGRTAMLSLTFDHRVVDGAYASRFLSDVAGELEAQRPLSPAEQGGEIRGPPYGETVEGGAVLHGPSAWSTSAPARQRKKPGMGRASSYRVRAGVVWSSTRRGPDTDGVA